MSSQRQIRFAELIRSLISECLIKEDFYESNLNLNTISVSFVKMSKDLRIANVYLIQMGERNNKDLLETVNQRKYIFQKYLSKAKLKSKFTPKINFFIDDSFEEAEKIHNLLNKKNVIRDLDES